MPQPMNPPGSYQFDDCRHAGVDHHSPTAEKIALFRSLFRGRVEAARRWY